MAPSIAGRAFNEREKCAIPFSEPFRGPKWPINGSLPLTDPFDDPSDILMTTRLIETWLPIAEIGLEGLRERTPMTPFPAPNRLHVWWARPTLVSLGNSQDQCYQHSERSQALQHLADSTSCGA